MKAIIELKRCLRPIGWFLGLWAASVAALAVVAGILRAWLL